MFKLILRSPARHLAYSLLCTTAKTKSRTLATASRQFLRISEEVQEALHTNKPVVSLETTIYTHGFPYPENLELAQHLENVVRAEGGVPATIGILNGKAMVGLSESEIQELVSSPGTRKISRRDIAFSLSSHSNSNPINGGTTIAGTIILSSLAGIKVFATGGLGGVHRGGESTMDISADLTELGRTRDVPVAVIAGGCKGFLDIPRTLEYLETQGVAVATFRDGRTGPIDFPAFWSRESGVRSPDVLEDEAHAAAIIHAQCETGIGSGLFFANPVPIEDEIPHGEMQSAIDKALAMAEAADSRGSANTPFVLNAIKEIIGKRSILANKSLVEANVRRGVGVARELCRLELGSRSFIPRGEVSKVPSKPANTTSHDKSSFAERDATRSATQLSNGARDSASQPQIIVAGSLALDTSCDFVPTSSSQSAAKPLMQTSNPSLIRQSVGGVGHNVALAAHLCGANVRLCSVVRDDVAGASIIAEVQQSGMSTDGIHKLPISRSHGTAQYVSFNDETKNLVVAMADMSILEQADSSTEKLWSTQMATIPQTENSRDSNRWLAVDANWTTPRLHKWLCEASSQNLKTAFEPVSVAKSTRLLTREAPYKDTPTLPPRLIDLATPNALELKEMHAAASAAGLFERQDWWETIDALGIPLGGVSSRLSSTIGKELVNAGIPQITLRLLPFIPCIVTKLGAEGVFLTQLLGKGDERLQSSRSAAYILSRSPTCSRGVGGVYMRLFPPSQKLSAEELVSVNGAGDTFLGALLAGLVQNHGSFVEDWIDLAQRASLLTLKHANAVSPILGEMRGLFGSKT